MVEGKVDSGFGEAIGSGRNFVSMSGGDCKHEVDTDAVPDWSPRTGKLWVCKLCGKKVYREVHPAPPLGKKLHVSKKERRRMKAQEKATANEDARV
jgi:hypothetical protein